jgi:hypothetical protein
MGVAYASLVNGFLAQLVEQQTFNLKRLGSNPRGPTIGDIMYTAPLRMEYLAKKEDLKPGDYAIIYFDTVTTPGYDRNDPNDTASVHYVYRTNDRDVWLKEIETIEKRNTENEYSKKLYVAFHIDQVASVSINIQVNVR